MTKPFPNIVFSTEVQQAIKSGIPLVALESTVITHGLPYPKNLELALSMEATVRAEGACPATIAILAGTIHIGLIKNQMEILVHEKYIRKISHRDFATAIVKKEFGGTTVAGTLFVANQADIKVFATGGIGGVHPHSSFDISTDLTALSQTPMIVVCAGAKAILDLPATLEILETKSVPVIGYQTDEFPAFYSSESGLPVSIRLNSPEEVVQFALTHWQLGFKSAVLVTLPPPAGSSLSSRDIKSAIEQAQKEALENNIFGQALTPYLLARLTELTKGATLKTNIDLLLNNAQLAARIAYNLQKNKLNFNHFSD
jgi:pseudouridine-5'-phosphate glycosidase